MARSNAAAQTIHRQWRMLQIIPRGRRIDAATIERRLADEGMEANRRTIQRDLEALARAIPGLCCDSSTRPYGWYWDNRAPVSDIPSMGLETAVMLRLVEAYLADALPRATTRALAPYFQKARTRLDEEGATRMARWAKKVRIVPHGLALLPRDVPDQILEVVYVALLEECCINARYEPRGRAERGYLIHPLGLVLRNGAFVLVCRFGDHDDICQVLLHRMKRAELSSTSARIPPGFRLDDHLQEGGIAFPLLGRILLKALVDRRASITLQETPLARGQRLADYDEQHELLEATVIDTVELRAWLHSYGAMIEVLEPKELRREFAASARALAARYHT